VSSSSLTSALQTELGDVGLAASGIVVAVSVPTAYPTTASPKPPNQSIPSSSASQPPLPLSAVIAISVTGALVLLAFLAFPFRKQISDTFFPKSLNKGKDIIDQQNDFDPRSNPNNNIHVVVPRRHKEETYGDSESIASGAIGGGWESQSGGSGSSWFPYFSSSDSSESSSASLGSWWGREPQEQEEMEEGGNMAYRRINELRRNKVCNVADNLVEPVVTCISPALSTLAVLAPFNLMGDQEPLDPHDFGSSSASASTSSPTMPYDDEEGRLATPLRPQREELFASHGRLSTGRLPPIPISPAAGSWQSEPIRYTQNPSIASPSDNFRGPQSTVHREASPSSPTGQVPVPVTLEQMASLSIDELRRDLTSEDAYLNSGHPVQGSSQPQHHLPQPTSESFTFADVYPPDSGENDDFSAAPVELSPHSHSHSHSVASSRSHASPAPRPPTVLMTQTLSGSNPLARRPRK